ncbi:MAG: hypothetical protein ACREM8_08865 [Vulcanimicrobiaceae bacterium]
MNGAIVAGVIAALAVVFVSHVAPTPFDNYVYLADAFVHGHAWIQWPGYRVDALSYHGRYYVIEGPLPALLLLPLVAVAGLDTNEAILGPILAGLAVGAGWEFARRLGAGRWARIWLCGFLLLGTDLFWCAYYGDVWFVAHLGAVAFTLLTLVELAGARRGWLVAVWAACAVECRFSLVLALPVYVALLVLDRPPSERRAALAGFAGGLVPFVAVWIGYNIARWGVPYDIGYTEWYHQDSAGESVGSPFQLRYLPMQLYSFFVQPPRPYPRFPYLIPLVGGVALTWTSPALLLAFLARRPTRLVVGLWSAAALVAGPSFIYYVNGYSQFGMRHALDFEPFLFGLMALGVRERMPRTGIVLIVYSMLAGIWGIWFWQTFYRP